MRTNPIKNPSFETDLTGYTGNTGTRTRDTTEFLFGTASMKCVTSIGRGAIYGAASNATANADSIPVSAYDVITFSAHVKWTSTPATTWVKIHWFTAAGAWISDSDSSISYTPPINTWTRLSVTGQAPSNAVKYGVVLSVGGTGGTYYTDGWLTEKAPFAGPYFDGSTTGVANYTHSWTGTAHASSSRAVATGTRTNLITNPSFETGTASWALTGSGTSLVRGSASVSNPYPIDGGVYYAAGTGPFISNKLPATAGLPYTASAWWSRSTGARNGGVFLHFYDASDVELSPPTTSESAINQPDKPQRFAQTRVAPAGTTQVAVRLHAGTITAVDSVLLEQTDYLDDYFDGNTKATTLTHAWTGTAHASTSTQVPGAPTDGTLVTLKVRESGAWVTRTAVPRHRRDGVWQYGNPKRWDGSAWVDLN